VKKSKKLWMIVAALLVSIFVFAIIYYVSFVIYVPDVITLPPQLDLKDDVVKVPNNAPLNSGNELNRVKISKENVSDIISSIDVSEEYSMQIAVDVLVNGIITSVTANYSTRNDLIHMSIYSNNLARYVITCDTVTFSWYDNMDLRIADGSTTLYNELGLIDFKDLQIVNASYVQSDGEDYIYIEAKDGENSAQYYVSVNTGIATKAEVQIGSITYKMQVSGYTEGGVSKTLFTLPDGTTLIK